MKGFLLAGTNSGIGKTTVSLGLMGALEEVSPFKVGPDYIDPGFHAFATGNPSYNLDLFLMGEEGVKYSFVKHHKGISVVEGVMGLYDGLGNSLDNYSSAHLARVLGLPVILVVDAAGKSTSIAAQVLGYKQLDTRINIAGVIINRVSSEKLYKSLKEAVEQYTGIKCLGYLPKNPEFEISSRHLGLCQAHEIQGLREKLDFLKEEVKKTIDVEAIKKIAEIKIPEAADPFKDIEGKYTGLKMAVAKDRAFTFYYQDNLELLQRMGVEIEYFSPLEDRIIPEVDIIYLGGGYPENFLKKLSENSSMINSLREFQKKGGTIYAECGGFIYMTRGMKGLDESFTELAGLADCTIQMGNRLDISRFGYIDVEFGGLKGKAHEFHYSKILEAGEMERAYKLSKPDGRSWKCGYTEKNLLAGYPHLHFFGSVEIIVELLERTKKHGIYKKTY